MARARRNRYRSSILPTLMIGGTAIGLLGLSGLLVAWAMGAFESTPEQRARAIDRTGQLAFPALARPVPAFEAIRREDLIDPRTGQLNVVWLNESLADKASRDTTELIGRVLGRDKTAGSVLTERDFMPAGTKPGVSAGIPPGKFAVTIPATNVPGLTQLRQGDRFDLMVSLTKRDDQESTTEPAAVFGGVKPPSLRVGQLSRQHGVKRLVTGGELIALSKDSKKSTIGARGLTPKPAANRSRSKPTEISVTFAEIAIDEEEIGPLTEAITTATQLTCIVRSSHPDAEIEEAFSRKGLVPVITTATKVQAYSALSDENLIDDATGQLHYYYFPPERVPEHWVTDPTSLYGRVVGRSLRRGSPITDADLLPIGTKPGISAGVPPGMVAMAVSTAQLSGFDDLQQADRFSILAKVPESAAKPINSSWVTLQGGSLSADTRRLEKMLSTGIREVVPTAIYLRSSESGTATIAVPEDRISEVAQLIRDKAELFVVARSSDQEQPPVAGESPWSAGESRSGTTTPMVASNLRDEVQLVVWQQTQRTDQQRVPILTRDVPAFELLSVSDFIDPASGQIRYVQFPANRLRADWITDLSTLIDRVPLRALKAGRTVSIRDLAPEGAPAGPSAGVPPGMRGVLVDSAQIEDLDLLRPGSRFNIVSGRAVQASQLGDRVRRTLSSADAVAEAEKLPGISASVSRTVVGDALLLAVLDSAQRTERRVLTERATQTRTTPSGGVEEVLVEERPRVETDTQTVQRFAIAVPVAQATTLIAFLDRSQPLRVSIVGPGSSQFESFPKSPSSTAGKSPTGGAMKMFVREHYYGSDAPFTEVFVTDRTYPQHRVIVPSKIQNPVIQGTVIETHFGQPQQLRVPHE